ncbi:MAG: hypothetical protein KHY73_12680, partial [Fusobacterium nucleatum]|nr:hypothetical protein [Fusobacterium nucleatum]
VSWQSTIDRFNDMKSMGLEPRAVNKLVFDKTVNGLAENTYKVTISGVADQVEVWNRQIKLFDSRLGNVQNLQNIIQKELGVLKEVSKLMSKGFSK